MHDSERQSYIANLTAFRRQLTEGSPMDAAVCAALKLLEREPAVQALLTRLQELRAAEVFSSAVSTEFGRLIDAVANDGKVEVARLRLVKPQNE